MKHRKTAALTGGIASGKSTVTRILQELGAAVLDADRIARQVVEPGQPAWQAIVAHFGQAILLPTGAIDRPQLSARIFSQPEERRMLEQMIHPQVIATINMQERELRAHDQKCVLVVDVPLLIEAGMHTDYLTVIVVTVAPETQLQRMMARDQIPASVARQRIAAQMPLAEKLRYATHIIDNNQTIAQTRQQVETMYHALASNGVAVQTLPRLARQTR